MSYKHLSTFERGRIEELSKLGFSIREIGRKINRSPSTISEELRRLEKYDAEEAHQNYLEKRRNSKTEGKANEELIEKIEKHLDLTWSPEQIANTIAKDEVSFKTIYIWLYTGKIKRKPKDVLRHKGKSLKAKETRGTFQVGLSIHKKPKALKQRKILGDFEIDSVVSGRGKDKECLATLVDRKTKYGIARKMEDRTANSMEKVLKEVIEKYPVVAFTSDRGKEFACYKNIKVPVYFADPYSSWQRGTNENFNGLLREFYPKGTSLSKISEEDLQEKVKLINKRPRKTLGWKSAEEMFLHELFDLT